MAKFEQNVDTADKSDPLHHHSFHSGRGATKSGWQKAAILDFKDGHHVIAIRANILSSKPLRRSLMVTKYTFSRTRNAMKLKEISISAKCCEY